MLFSQCALDAPARLPHTRGMRILLTTAAFAAALLAGCSSPGSAYVRAHPELSPAHRAILLTGKIPGGVAVEGMTKEQVLLAAGRPDFAAKDGKTERWSYTHTHYRNMTPDEDPSQLYGSGFNTGKNWTETRALGERPSVTERTTVFFNGERATHTQITARPDAR